MATVVIRLLIITGFHVSKMDADSEERQRDLISRREKRWSMNSQRLEQIVAELMRPIGDLRRSFDTDLSALLEEYLTEGGLRALEEEPGEPTAAPNFPELALLLQQSANIYGRKVDLLYQHVLECSESLHTNTDTHDSHDTSQSVVEGQSGATPRRKRRASGAGSGWARVALEPCAGARREAELRPPPTLPRMYVELEPRVLAACDVPLLDYAGEPVGLLQDFNVTWRLHGGLLVDELECGEEEVSCALRAIPLSELQAAIEAAAPPSPPAWLEPPDPAGEHPACSTPIPTGNSLYIPLSELQAAIEAAAPPSPPAWLEPPDPAGEHPACSTPIPTGNSLYIPLSELQAAIEAAAPPSPPAWLEPPDPAGEHPACSTPIPTDETPAAVEPAAEPPAEPPTEPEPPAAPTPVKSRKRKQEDPDLFQKGAGKIHLTTELRVFLKEEREFSLSDKLISRVVGMRCAKIIAARARLSLEPEITEFRGFDEVDKYDLIDIGGFLGFKATTESEATDVSLCLSRLASAAESDDDGFFEQSSLGSEGSRPGRTPPHTPPLPAPHTPQAVEYAAQPEWMSWRALVVARAAAGEARGLDVRALGAAVLAALPGPRGGHGEGEGERERGGPGPPTGFETVLNAAANDDADVSRLFLATLFLANAGNVEVVQPPPLALGSFSLRLASRDERRYCAAAAADPAFLAR